MHFWCALRMVHLLAAVVLIGSSVFSRVHGGPPDVFVIGPTWCRVLSISVDCALQRAMIWMEKSRIYYNHPKPRKTGPFMLKTTMAVNGGSTFGELRNILKIDAWNSPTVGHFDSLHMIAESSMQCWLWFSNKKSKPTKTIKTIAKRDGLSCEKTINSRSLTFLSWTLNHSCFVAEYDWTVPNYRFEHPCSTHPLFSFINLLRACLSPQKWRPSNLP